MGKWRAFISSYVNKFYGGEPNEYRSNQYLLVNKRGEDFDHNGYLGTYRKVHPWEEVGTLKEVKEFLNQHVTKADRRNWVIYKVYTPTHTKLPQSDSKGGQS